MISTAGFDEGAKAVAKDHHVQLLSYREAIETDWQNFIGPSTWLTILFKETYNVTANIVLSDNQIIQVPLDCQFFDSNQQPIFIMQEVLDNQIVETINTIGPFTNLTEAIQPLFVHGKDTFFRVRAMSFEGMFRAKEFPVNLAFVGGHVVDNVVDQETVYKAAFTEGFNWKEVLASSNFKELTQDEYNRHYWE